MQMELEYRGKAKLFIECRQLGLPVEERDSMECLELIYSLARANGWQFYGDASANDRKIEKIIKKIRNFIEYGSYLPN